MSPKSSEDQKKKFLNGKFEDFLSPKASEDQKCSKINQHSYADHCQIIGGGGAVVDHSQIIGGIYPPIYPGFGTLEYCAYGFKTIRNFKAKIVASQQSLTALKVIERGPGDALPRRKMLDPRQKNFGLVMLVV